MIKKESEILYETEKKRVDAECEAFYKTNHDKDYEECVRIAHIAYNRLLPDLVDPEKGERVQNILMAFLEGKPLTPITEEDEFELMMVDASSNEKMYSCVRRPSLIRFMGDDKATTYLDTNRAHCINSVTNAAYEPDIIEYLILDSKFPITFPYFPNESISMFTYRFSSPDKETIYFGLRGIRPNKHTEPIFFHDYYTFTKDKHFKEEISREEFFQAMNEYVSLDL